jgi:hypothetical protein
VITPAPPPVTGSAAESPARIRVKAPTALFTATPPPEGGAGAANSPPTHPPTDPPEAGGLPKLVDIQWETKRDGSIEAWHAPEGTRNRSSKTYMGRLGKQRLAAWQQSETPEEFQEAVRSWVKLKREEKKL